MKSNKSHYVRKWPNYRAHINLVDLFNPKKKISLKVPDMLDSP